MHLFGVSTSLIPHVSWKQRTANMPVMIQQSWGPMPCIASVALKAPVGLHAFAEAPDSYPPLNSDIVTSNSRSTSAVIHMIFRIAVCSGDTNAGDSMLDIY